MSTKNNNVYKKRPSKKEMKLRKQERKSPKKFYENNNDSDEDLEISLLNKNEYYFTGQIKSEEKIIDGKEYIFEYYRNGSTKSIKEFENYICVKELNFEDKHPLF